MIIWGGTIDGVNSLNDGGQYNPADNAWPATSSGAPVGRHNYTAVWTGSAMIVWGGQHDSGNLNDNWSYTPGTTAFLYRKL
jgi:hypothetical protein